MKENNKDIKEKFLGFGRQEFAEWLGKGLIEIYQSNSQSDLSKMNNSFDGMGEKIFSKETITEGLAQIYENDIPEPSKLLFRQAIGDVLGETNPNKMVSTEAVEDLIYLTGRIKEQEPLKSFRPVVDRININHEEIIYPMINVLSLLSPSEEVYESARELIESPRFDSGYIFETLDILLACKPLETPAILNKYSSDIKSLKNECHELGESEWATYKEAAMTFSSNILSRVPDTQKGEAKNILDELIS